MGLVQFMNKLQNLIATALKSEGNKPSFKSKFEEAFHWQLKHATDIADGIPNYRFDLNRKWEFDFAWPDVLIAVEIEGGIWRKGGGAHSHPTNILRDIEKYNHAARAGWRIFRFTTDMVDSGEALVFLGSLNLPKKKLTTIS